MITLARALWRRTRVSKPEHGIGNKDGEREGRQHAAVGGGQAHAAAETGEDRPAVPDDRQSSRQRGDPAGRGIMQRQPGGGEALGHVQDEDQGARQEARLAEGIGGGGMARAGRRAHPRP